MPHDRGSNDLEIGVIQRLQKVFDGLEAQYPSAYELVAECLPASVRHRILEVLVRFPEVVEYGSYPYTLIKRCVL